jgi:hypothetical protein
LSYELTIGTGANVVAGVDGLTVDVRHWSTVGRDTVAAEGLFVDADDAAWFSFVIRQLAEGPP